MSVTSQPVSIAIFAMLMRFISFIFIVQIILYFGHGIDLVLSNAGGGLYHSVIPGACEFMAKFSIARSL